MKVSATGMPVRAVNSRRAADAPTRMTPLPARMTGRLAERMIPAALSSSSCAGSGRLTEARTGSGGASTSASITSSGSSRCVAPGFSAGRP